MTTSAERQIVKDIKEKLCYIPLNDPLEEIKKSEVDEYPYLREYMLPDGSTMVIGSELFQVPQVLFNPALIGVQSKGCHHMIRDSIQKCGKEYQKHLYEKIVLGGGSTMFPGMGARLQRLLMMENSDCPMNVKVHGSENRHISSWVGGSIISKLFSQTTEFWATKEEYEEMGSSIVDRKGKSSFSGLTNSMLVNWEDRDWIERVEFLKSLWIEKEVVWGSVLIISFACGKYSQSPLNIPKLFF